SSPHPSPVCVPWRSAASSGGHGAGAAAAARRSAAVPASARTGSTSRPGSRCPPFPLTPELCPAPLEPRLERRLYRRLTLPVVADQRVAIDRPQPRQGRPHLALRLTGDHRVLRRAALD